jgi:hypothetical protein
VVPEAAADSATYMAMVVPRGMEKVPVKAGPTTRVGEGRGGERARVTVLEVALVTVQVMRTEGS